MASQKPSGSTLPSWVIDWTAKELGTMRDNHLGTNGFTGMHGLSTIQAEASFITTTNSYHIDSCVTSTVWGSFLGTLHIYKPDSTCTPQESRLFRSFQTAEGPQAFCSSATRLHDQLWVLTGSQCPLILRLIGKDHRLVSSACIVPQFESSVAETVGDLVRQAQNRQGGRQRILIV